MKVTLHYDKALRFIGKNSSGLETYFDTSVAGGGLNSAPSPVESVALSTAACTSMDVIGIVGKRRKQIDQFNVDVEYERAEEHPKVITKLHMDFAVVSPDLTQDELEKAITLSQDKYCTVSIMVQRSGCVITWSATIIRPSV